MRLDPLTSLGEASDVTDSRRSEARRRFSAHLAGAVLGAGVMPAALRAQDYPSKPVRVIVPFAPGGGGDVLARMVMGRAARELGQNVVFENISGAGGNLGSQTATRAPADGYTVLYGTNGTFAINHSLYKNPGFDPLRDFEPVSLLTRIACIAAVRPGLDVSSFPELLARIKANPGKFTYASAGNGTTSHLAAELLKASAGVSIVHIPYRGGAPALTDLIGGQIDMMIEVMPNIGPQVRSGRVRGLAVSTATRVASFPAVPTIAESGVPGFDVGAWDAVVVPKGTPTAAIARLQSAIGAALDDPALRQQLADRGAEPALRPEGELSGFIRSEIDRWGSAVARSGATVD